ncbi:response regulator transcription factor [Erythrobacter sp. R86502]|uniref:helix-turn-helix transcriptional regulator n=1 Tax=Erythrobacter sp. R86502 TaxID=3093846 RepID=UPI0036D21254
MHKVREGFRDRKDWQDRYEYQNVHRLADDAEEREDVSVMVICREGFMREAIGTSLHNAGITHVDGVGTISDLVANDTECQTFLCIVPSEADACGDDELVQLERLQDRNWIVMSHACHCPIFSKLHQLGANVSAVPFDISGRDLAHLARLSANRHRVLVDKFCEPNLSFAPRLEIGKLNEDQTRLLRQIARGDSNKLIAMNENWSETKVKMQVRALLKKLDVTNRTQAAVLAIRSGL